MFSCYNAEHSGRRNVLLCYQGPAFFIDWGVVLVSLMTFGYGNPPMDIRVIAETKKLTAYLNRVQRKQIPFAAKNALNDVAFDARSYLKKALPRRLDRPTPAMVSSVRVKKSNKRDLTAIVGFVGLGFMKSPWSETPAEIMRRHIKGGIRSAKSGRLRIPSNPHGAGIKLNKYGNIASKKNKIAKMLGNKDQFFEGVPKGEGYSSKDAGIWEKTPRDSKRAKGTRAKKWKATGKIVQRIAYEPSTRYRFRFPFKKIVELAVKNNYRKRFNAALDYALKSA